MTFPSEEEKEICLDSLRQAERNLGVFRLKLEALRLHDLAAYTISIHASKMLAKIFENADSTPARAGVIKETLHLFGYNPTIE